MTTELPHQAVHLWYVRISDLPPSCIRRYPALLTGAERERWLRFKFDKDRRQYLVSRALVRTVLSRYAAPPPEAWRFRANPYGKPRIVPAPGLPPLEFNLAHTEGLAVCAVTLDREIGVDVENLERQNLTMDIARRHFAPAEVRYLDRLPPEQRREALFAFWTLKEAYIKARGMGLSLRLDAFAFTLEPLAIAFASPPDDDPAHWQFARYRPTPRHPLALAVERAAGEELEVILREIVPLAEEGDSP